MTQWIKTVNFRDLLEEWNDDADELQEIKRIKPLWVERFESINELKNFVPALKKVKTLNGFNKWLDSVYDYCDYERIWIEM